MKLAPSLPLKNCPLEGGRNGHYWPQFFIITISETDTSFHSSEKSFDQGAISVG
jgi:hypothetical protein